MDRSILKIKKTDILKCRVTAFEKLAIQVKADSLGLSTSEYLRKCAMGRQLPQTMTDKQTEAYILLKEYQANFKRITNMFRTKSEDLLKAEILGVIAEIEKHLNAIQNGFQSESNQR
ncbi:hypothetical protein CAPN004_23430 [Capnocytophaga cynodegmi]|uniref:plasmid mobilization protein n=1 Tax=Capnocytophaga cynodegmi TaxID=28189 RepID=UPI001AD3EA29|nr:hypothetical protein [Capnocytophaga cynodegmi]GIM53314.1 hypothetical protein CAPN004_23430 [Capnocytophaga cynodegmi]